MDNKKISVIIPCFNASNTIYYAIQSIIKQSYKNVELVIVDDGSTDNTELIVKELCADSSIDMVFLSQSNKGVSEARNLGIYNCSGEYVCFLDADDYYDSDFLLELYGLLESTHTDIALCKYRYMHSYTVGKQINNRNNKYICPREIVLKRYLNKRANRISFACCMYKARIIKENDVKFPTGIRYGEDSLFFLYYLSYCKNGGSILTRELYNYVVRPESASHERNYNRIQVIDSIEKGLEYWRDNDCISDDYIQYIKARSIWAIAKDFAIADSYLLRKLENDYDVTKAMRIMSKYSDERAVKYSAIMYLIEPCLFETTVKIFRKRGERK